MSYKPYYTNGWKSGEAGGTPITPEALNHMEAGIEAAGTHTDSTSNPHKVTAAQVGAAAASHGNHVPATQTANNAIFLRNDNTWQKVTPANIGALPLTGGTLTGNLKISGNSKTIGMGTGENDVYIHNSASNKYLQLKDDGTLSYNNNAIYHAGNKPTYSDVGAAASSHNHAASNITSGTLALARGGTGSSGASVASASNSYHTAYFSKFGNLVICSILPKSADGTQYDTSITIPSGYRPSSNKSFQFYSWTNKNAGGAGTVQITANAGGGLKFQQAYGFAIHDIKYTLSWTV